MPSTSWSSSWREFLYCNAPQAVHVVAILMMSESQPSSSIHCTEGYQGTATAGLRTHNNTDLDLMVAFRSFRRIFSCRWLWREVDHNVSYFTIKVTFKVQMQLVTSGEDKVPKSFIWYPWNYRCDFKWNIMWRTSIVVLLLLSTNCPKEYLPL